MPHSPTEDAQPIVIMHVIRVHDDVHPQQTPNHMQSYQRAAAVAASENGVHVSAWFSVEGTVLGDGRSWDQVRFNLFPKPW